MLSTISISESPNMLAASPAKSRPKPGVRNAARITRLTPQAVGPGRWPRRWPARDQPARPATPAARLPADGRADRTARRAGAAGRSARPGASAASSAVSHSWDCTSPVASRQAGVSLSRDARAARRRCSSRSTSMSVRASASTRPDPSGSPSSPSVPHSRASLTTCQGRLRPVPPRASRTNPCSASLRRCHEQFDGDSPSYAAAPLAVIGPWVTSASSRAIRTGCASALSARASVTRRRVSGMR